MTRPGGESPASLLLVVPSSIFHARAPLLSLQDAAADRPLGIPRSIHPPPHDRSRPSLLFLCIVGRISVFVPPIAPSSHRAFSILGRYQSTSAAASARACVSAVHTHLAAAPTTPPRRPPPNSMIVVGRRQQQQQQRQRLSVSLLALVLYALSSSLAMLLLRTTGSAAFLLAGSGRPRAAATAAATGSGWLAGRRGLASKTGTSACPLGGWDRPHVMT